MQTNAFTFSSSTNEVCHITHTLPYLSMYLKYRVQEEINKEMIQEFGLCLDDDVVNAQKKLGLVQAACRGLVYAAAQRK